VTGVPKITVHPSNVSKAHADHHKYFLSTAVSYSAADLSLSSNAAMYTNFTLFVWFPQQWLMFVDYSRQWNTMKRYA
jgi:hypothetical protein